MRDTPRTCKLAQIGSMIALCLGVVVLAGLGYFAVDERELLKEVLKGHSVVGAIVALVKLGGAAGLASFAIWFLRKANEWFTVAWMVQYRAELGEECPYYDRASSARPQISLKQELVQYLRWRMYGKPLKESVHNPEWGAPSGNGKPRASVETDATAYPGWSANGTADESTGRKAPESENDKRDAKTVGVPRVRAVKRS
jgi:hypothetical protein